jgi:hypothetical protein
MPPSMFKKEFEDTKGVFIIRKSKKERQHHGQKYKSTNNDLQDIHIIQKIRNPYMCY